MPLLAASEKGIGRAESVFEKRLEMWWAWMPKLLIRSALERATLEGDSPLGKNNMVLLKRVGLPGLEVWIRLD